MVDIARPSQARKKRIRRILIRGRAARRHRAHHGGRFAAEARGAVGRSRHRLDRHRQARLDAAPGSRFGHARARRNPLDSGDDAGTGRAYRAPSRRDGEAGYGHPRAEQPRAAAVGQGSAAGLSVGAGHTSSTAKQELESALLNQQGEVAGIEASYKNAALNLEAQEKLFKDGLVSEIQLKQSRSARRGTRRTG